MAMTTEATTDALLPLRESFSEPPLERSARTSATDPKIKGSLLIFHTNLLYEGPGSARPGPGSGPVSCSRIVRPDHAAGSFTARSGSQPYVRVYSLFLKK